MECPVCGRLPRRGNDPLGRGGDAFCSRGDDAQETIECERLGRERAEAQCVKALEVGAKAAQVIHDLIKVHDEDQACVLRHGAMTVALRTELNRIFDAFDLKEGDPLAPRTADSVIACNILNRNAIKDMREYVRRLSKRVETLGGELP